MLFNNVSGIHIRSRLVVSDDSKVLRATKITPKVVLWTSKVVLNHTKDIISKFSYDVIMYNSMYQSSDHFSST